MNINRRSCFYLLYGPQMPHIVHNDLRSFHLYVYLFAITESAPKTHHQTRSSYSVTYVSFRTRYSKGQQPGSSSWVERAPSHGRPVECKANRWDERTIRQVDQPRPSFLNWDQVNNNLLGINFSACHIFKPQRAALLMHLLTHVLK